MLILNILINTHKIIAMNKKYVDKIIIIVAHYMQYTSKNISQINTEQLNCHLIISGIL